MTWEEAFRRCKDKRWECSKERVSDCIKIEAHCGMMVYRDTWGGSPGAKYVYPPNIIERLLGITWEEKIKKAELWCQRFCDKENQKEDLARRVLEGKDGE